MGRRSKAVKLVGGVRGGLALLDDDECRWAIEEGERDIDDGVGFFRGQARPDTALKAACIDAYRGRFGGRADLPGAVGRAGLRFPDRPRLPRLQDGASQPHGGAPRGIGA